METKDKNKRTTYKRITEDIRVELIERVVNKKQNIKDVVNEMGVNISTAKAILKVYQEEGRVGKKKKRDKVINVIQTYSFYTIDGNNIEKIAQTIIEQEKKSIQTSDPKDVQKELKQKSRQRAQYLIKDVTDKYKNTAELAQMQRNFNELNALQNHIFYQYCNQSGYCFNPISYSFK